MARNSSSKPECLYYRQCDMQIKRYKVVFMVDTDMAHGMFEDTHAARNKARQ